MEFFRVSRSPLTADRQLALQRRVERTRQSKERQDGQQALVLQGHRGPEHSHPQNMGGNAGMGGKDKPGALSQHPWLFPSNVLFKKSPQK